MQQGVSTSLTQASLLEVRMQRAPERVSEISIALVMAFSSVVSRWLNSNPGSFTERTTISPLKPPATCGGAAPCPAMVSRCRQARGSYGNAPEGARARGVVRCGAA